MQVKRALEVAAAGAHNLLMCGAPGAGKTLMACGALDPAADGPGRGARSHQDLLGQWHAARHHTISQAGLVGGSKIRPGEITRAHRGVLFLVELPEFGQQTLDVLRQPLEDRIVTISRASGSLTFPANFILIAAMNPCPRNHHADITAPQQEVTVL